MNPTRRVMEFDHHLYVMLLKATLGSSFNSVIMLAMHKADTVNLSHLQVAFPEIYSEWRRLENANEFIEREALENARDYFGDPERATGA
jgi:hypothetical protein